MLARLYVGISDDDEIVLGMESVELALGSFSIQKQALTYICGWFNRSSCLIKEAQ